jgi:hypothetical protein
MAKKPETIFKEKVIELLEQIPRSYWVKIQMVALRGVPDYLGVVSGHAVALELKVSAKVEALQHYVLNQYKGAGAYARVVHPGNLTEVIRDLYYFVPEAPQGHVLQALERAEAIRLRYLIPK